MLPRFLPEPEPWLIDSSFLMSRPLGSTTTPASSGFPATTGRSASERRDRYSMPSVSASARSLSRPWGLRPRTPFRRSPSHVPCKSRRFRITPPTRRAPPGQQSGSPPSSSQRACNDLRFRCHLRNFRRFTSARPTHRALLERLPDPHLTRSSAPFPCHSPRRSSANAAQGGLAPAPEGRHRRASNPPSLAQLRLWKGSSTRLLPQRS